MQNLIQVVQVRVSSIVKWTTAAIPIILTQALDVTMMKTSTLVKELIPSYHKVFYKNFEEEKSI